MKVFKTVITALDSTGNLSVFHGKPVCAQSRAQAQAELDRAGLGYMQVVDDGDDAKDEFSAILYASMSRDHVHLQ